MNTSSSADRHADHPSSTGSVPPEGANPASSIAAVTSVSSDSQASSASPAVKDKKAALGVIMKILPPMLEAYNWGQGVKAKALAREFSQALAQHYPAVSKSIERNLGRELMPMRMNSMPESLLAQETCRHGLDAVILEEGVIQACRAIIDEHHQMARLSAFALAPRHRVLLHGPPGNGKTMLAEALALELQVPYFRVKYSGLIDSHLGGSGKNLETVFQYASAAPCLVFLDEFDGIGMERGNNQDVGEARRITNQLLISLERLPAHTVFVAATNALELMDRALLRRFDFKLEIASPSKELRLRCARQQLRRELTPGFDIEHHADEVATLALENLFEVVELCKMMRRDLVLHQGAGIQALLHPA